jgi:heptosyltransferase-1
MVSGRWGEVQKSCHLQMRTVSDASPPPLLEGNPQDRRLGQRPAERAAETEDAPRRILILSAAGLGDFVLGTPALRAIRQRFPQASIWLLTIAEVRPLAERCPYVDAVRTVDLRRSRSALAWVLGSGRRERWQLIRELRAMRFDIAANLYFIGTRVGGLRMAIFLWAIGAGRTVCRHGSGRRVGFPLRLTKEEGHEIDSQLRVALQLGATLTSDLPELWVTAEDRAVCDALLQERGVRASDRLACLHAGSAQPEKRWPADRFATVGQRLAEAGARVVLIGTEGERSLCASLVQAIPGAISLAGESSLPILAALLQRAALLVTNDSGPMHMAAALGTALVVPFGPEAPNRFAPRGRAPCLVFAATQRPGGPPWWEGIAPKTVAEAATRLFTEQSAQQQPPNRDP